MRLRTWLREPEALFWTFGFPILMAVGLGLAFGEGETVVTPIAVERGSAAERYLPALAGDEALAVRLLDADAAAAALRRGEVALLITGQDAVVYRYDPTRADSRTAQLLSDGAIQHAAGVEPPVPTREEPVRQRGARYIDWVIPGLIGLNLMSTGMWGIGFGIVYMRQKKQLKRLIATPMRRSDFLSAQVLARLVFVVLEVPPIIFFAWWLFDVRVEGSWLALSAVVLLGTVAFAGLGLLVSSRVRTIEGVSGLMNVVMLPMFILSGVFFSAARYPDAMQPFIQALPLTALNNALRTVYNDGLPLTAAATELAILAAWLVGSFLLSIRFFRWQ
jgi:ABC-2 type transport system permease protein